MRSVWVYTFGSGRSEGVELITDRKERRRELGGKGAGVAEMTAAGLPVPPGFTIACEASLTFLRDKELPRELDEQADHALAELEQRMGRRLGDVENPLLVSVRSGSPQSMPGMMDTLLNLGLNERTVEGLAARTHNPRFAWDAYRRFLEQFATLVFGLSRADFEEVLADTKRRRKVTHDYELDAETLKKSVVPKFRKMIQSAIGRDVPDDPHEQLQLAREAVFRSWTNPRAIAYRRRFGIPDDLGTAVTVQAMVFGNLGDTSATGVGFTRNPATGEHVFYGEFLPNAQGEDVVAGIRTPHPIAELERVLPEAYRDLRAHTALLERTYRWPQDFEFTIEDGKLWLLQTRDAKSTARAALRWAVYFLDAGVISEEDALARVDARSLDQLLHPVFEEKARAAAEVIAKGLAAGPGAASGEAVFSAAEAIARTQRGRAVILVRPETSADDVAGMMSAQGVLTATGGLTSHAAVVGRQLGKACVVGAGALQVDVEKRIARIGKRTLREGEPIAIDGGTGEVFFEALPTASSEVLRCATGELRASHSQVYRDFDRILTIADRYRRLEVEANADQPQDARLALELGAKGIGLCRTEHMFFGEDRLPIVRRMILSAPSARAGLVALKEQGIQVEVRRKRLQPVTNGRRPPRAVFSEIEEKHGAALLTYLQALETLLPLQRVDFEGLFEEMDGHPVTIRLLDPPLHEFLPTRDHLIEARAMLAAGRKPADWKHLQRDLERMLPVRRRSKTALVEEALHLVDALREQNPMLGHRGCRVGLTYPEITQMQARAICEAAAACRGRGIDVRPKVMIPMVGVVAELERQAALVREVAAEVEREHGISLGLQVGTMIEVPRAALDAGAIARVADFFSFGTNDLTQLTFGYSRDDSGRFVPLYLDERILSADPFVSLDPVIGRLIRLAVNDARMEQPELHIGLCGEHGGDPLSIALVHALGLDAVSCSPYRVPIARLAAAQAALAARRLAARPPARPEPSRDRDLQVPPTERRT